MNVNVTSMCCPASELLLLNYAHPREVWALKMANFLSLHEGLIDESIIEGLDLGWLVRDEGAGSLVLKDVFDGVEETVASFVYLRVCNRDVLVEVSLRHGLILVDSVVDRDCDVKRLMSKCIVVERLVDGCVCDSVGVGVHYIGHSWLELIPCLISEGTSDVVVLLVEHFVPKSVELIHIIVILEREVVRSSVTVDELRVVAILAMQWLTEVAHVMNKQTQSIRLSNILIVAELVHKVQVDVRSLIVVSTLA